jgi:hypothetical protein
MWKGLYRGARDRRQQLPRGLPRFGGHVWQAVIPMQALFAASMSVAEALGERWA